MRDDYYNQRYLGAFMIWRQEFATYCQRLRCAHSLWLLKQATEGERNGGWFMYHNAYFI